MLRRKYMKLASTGSYLPKKVVSNDDLAKIVDTSDEWISQRVGISSRCYASTEETTLFMAKKAACDAIASADIDIKDIGLVLVATSTADAVMPSVAVQLQADLGIENCVAFDINAACSGFVYLIDIAMQYIQNGFDRLVLLVASERMSRLMDWEDRSTCVLFGDGAGAAIFHSSDTPGVVQSILHSDGKYKDLLYANSSLPDKLYSTSCHSSILKMEGKKVFKHAVGSLSSLVNELLESSGMRASEIDFLVPHQANHRIIQATAKKLDMPLDRVVLTLDKHGNTSAASIPLALDYAIKNKIVARGDVLLLEAFGAGIVWGGCILKY